MSERSSCRLLSLNGSTGTLTHGTFTGLPDRPNPGDLLIFNDTRVIPARLFGHKTSDGKIGVLVERMLDEKHILMHIRASKAPKPGVELLLGDDESINVTMTARHGILSEVELNNDRSVLDILNNIGHIPLPPYIGRPNEDADRELYRTIYNEKPGAVTAPTAGLYFGEPLLEKLHAKGVGMAFVTLHVGAGIFQLVCVDTIEDHIMYSEYAEIPQDMIGVVLAAEARSNQVIAAGTTPTRSLEDTAQAVKNDLVKPFFGDARIFICPGFQYKVVDVLVTNFHLPESMLIVLVSAFADYQHTMNAYKVAVEEKYRFFSYDDAMFIAYNPQAISERVGEQFRGAGLNVGLFF